MKPLHRLALLSMVCLMIPATGRAQDPLPNWNPTGNREAIISFVQQVTDAGHPNHVHPRDRLAVFDMDGTLLCERPDYVTALVSRAMLRKRLEENPALADSHPAYRAIADDDRTYLKRFYRDVHLQAFGGISHAAMHRFVNEYITGNLHPVTSLPYSEMTYVPMLELVRYLEANGFAVYVVSASSQEFIRAFCEAVLGIPPERVIGSAVQFTLAEHATSEEDPFLRLPLWDEPYNSGDGKAVRIRERTGRIPLLACGNGTGDVDMLKLAASNPLPHLVLVLDHDDNDREIEYRKPYLLKVAESENWRVIGVKDDFRTVFRGLNASAGSAEAPAAGATPSPPAGN